MKKSTVPATTPTPIANKEEFATTLDEIATLGVNLDVLIAAKEAALQDVLLEHDPAITETIARIAELTKIAELYAASNRETLFVKGKKTGTTSLTSYSYRLGQPQLKTLSGWTWAKVTALLAKTRRKRYIVIKEAIDKDALRLHVRPRKLSKLGLKIVQEEKFHVERKTTETPAA